MDRTQYAKIRSEALSFSVCVRSSARTPEESRRRKNDTTNHASFQGDGNEEKGSPRDR